MSKINSGILGGFSGKLETVVGYRSNGKSIITSLPKLKSINHIPTLITNAKKWKSLSDIYPRLQPMITRECIRIGYPKVLPSDLIMKQNLKQWSLNQNAESNYFFFDPFKNALQPKTQILYTYYPVSAGVQKSGYLPIKGFVGNITTSRTRYWEYNNVLQNLDIAVNVNTLGSGTPSSLTPAGKFYAQISTLWNTPKTYFSSMVIFYSIRP
jgi:hypothetical protein